MVLFHRMPELLRKLPEKWQFRVLEYSGLVLAGIVLISAATAFLLLFDVEKHWHDGYHTVQVDFTTSQSTENTSFRFHAYFNIDGKGPFVVTTKSMAQAHMITDTACVEARMRKSGRRTYQIAHPSKCIAEGR